MATLSSQLILRLIDGVSGPAKRTVASLRSVSAATRATSVAAVHGMRNVTGAVTAGIGAIGLYKAHESVMKFATASNKLSAANPDFKIDDIKEVQKLAREVSRQTLFDPGTLMDAANNLARADVSIQAIKGTLKPLSVAAMAADVPVNEFGGQLRKTRFQFQNVAEDARRSGENILILGRPRYVCRTEGPRYLRRFCRGDEGRRCGSA